MTPREWIGQAREQTVSRFQASDGAVYEYRSRTLDALAAVLELHRMDTDVVHRWCVADGRTWPCPTVTAITTALGLDQEAP